MFRNYLLQLLLLGFVISLVVSEDKLPPGHSEDEYDKEHEEASKDDHQDDKEAEHHDDKDEQHDDKDEHRDDKDDHHDEDEHDEKKGDDHEDDDHHDDKKDVDDDEGDHDKDDDEGDQSDGGDNEEHDQTEHDAFLGDHHKDFKGLSAEETKQKLEQLVKSEVDLDKDGFVTEDELRLRLLNTSRKHRKTEVNSTVTFHDDNKDGKVSWEEFKKAHFTHTEGKEDDKATKEQMAEDEAKFKYADVNGDGMLDLHEYVTFYHPGDDERMSAWVIQDTLKKHDTDKDGMISKSEYMATFSDANNDAKIELEKDFDTSFDKNKDGKLDQTEIRHWLFPDDDMAKEEPAHMIKEADDNKDGKLSMEEILKHSSVFVDNGETPEHDEL